MAAATPLRSVTLALAIAVLAAVALVPVAAARPLEGKQYRVGGPDGWRVPPPDVKEKFYSDWASGITFNVGDSLEFAYKNDSVVIQVGKAGYYHCTETPPAGAGAEPRDGSVLFRLDAPGYAYYASADLDHCKMGERLMINVLPAGQPASPGPWAPGPTAAGHSIAASSVRVIGLVAPVALAMAGLL